MSIHGKKLNKGEWAEFYVMLKILGDGKLYASNRLMQKTSAYLDVLKVIREEVQHNIIYYCIDSDQAVVTIKCRDEVLLQLPMSDFTKNANELLSGMGKTGKSIEAPQSVCDFAEKIFVEKPKAPAVKSLGNFGGKNDIYIEVRDCYTSVVSVMGFSIKSKYSALPTLFNAGTSSQFLFKVNSCDSSLMESFNAIKANDDTRNWASCKDFILKNKLHLEYVQTKNPVYKNNLFLVRESMEKILAACVYDRLIEYPSNNKVKETIDRIAKSNPFNVPNPDVYYEKAMKDFLMASFTGMTAGKEWDGKEQVNGGYIIVKEDGDVLCYHSSDREAFRDYLFRNTHFEYVSTNKYKWGYIEKINNEYYLPLNISIRFNSSNR